MKYRPIHSAAIVLLVKLAVVAACASAAACAASARVATINGALVTVDASRDAFVAYDAGHQGALVMKAATLEEGKSAVATYREQREKVTALFGLAYRAIAAASVANDDPSIASLKLALGQLADGLAPFTGGAK